MRRQPSLTWMKPPPAMCMDLELCKAVCSPPIPPARGAHARLCPWREMTRGPRALPSFTPGALETNSSGGATSHNKPDCLQGGRAKETFPRFPQFLLVYKPGRVCVARFKKKKREHTPQSQGDQR